MLNDFKKFLLRGNIVDLAVAVVIGGAFALVVTSFTTGVVSPLVGLIAGQNFDSLTITLVDPSGSDPGVVLAYGAVITAVDQLRHRRGRDLLRRGEADAGHGGAPGAR